MSSCCSIPVRNNRLVVGRGHYNHLAVAQGQEVEGQLQLADEPEVAPAVEEVGQRLVVEPRHLSLLRTAGKIVGLRLSVSRNLYRTYSTPFMMC